MDAVEANGSQPAKQRGKPLPKLQLLIVLLIQFSEPITATVIYPFIQQLVRHTGVTEGDEKKTGYFAGFIESAFFVTEFATTYAWGRASDFYGRRPILLLAPLGLSIATVGLGSTKLFGMVVLFRAMQGVFNGNLGVAKTVLVELGGPRNTATTLSLIPLMWSIGVTLGPIVGGTLAFPSSRWPSLLGRNEFSVQYPFFLPCATVAAIGFISFLLALVGFKETKRRNYACLAPAGVTEETSLLCDGTGALEREANPTFRQLFPPRFKRCLFNHGFLCFTEMSYQVLLPLFYSTSITSGGLGLEPHHVGLIMGTYGIAAALVQLFLMAKLLERYPPQKIFSASMVVLSLAISTLPVIKYFASRAGRVNGFVMLLLVFQQGCALSMYTAYCAVHILIVKSVVSKAGLAGSNSIAQMLSCSMRTFAPPLTSSLYAISLQRTLAGGNLVFYVLMGVSAISVSVSITLVKYLKVHDG